MTIKLCKTALAIGVVNALALSAAHADFLKDGKASIDTRNFWFSNDYREDPGQNKVQEWAQGLTFKYLSGFTEGDIGFGLDAALMVGIKLDSSPDRSGSGLLARDAQARSGGPSYSRRAQDEYSKLALTGKVRLYRDTVVQYGALTPSLGVLQPSSTRLFTQGFEGAQITSKAFDKLTLSAGRLDKVRQRDSTDYQDISIAYGSGQYVQTSRGNAFNFAAVDYQLSPQLNLSYHYGQLENVYGQHYLGLKAKVPFGPGNVVGDVRLFSSGDIGGAEAGHIDNTVYSGIGGYSLAGHTLQGGYQKIKGDGAFPFLDGTATYLLTELMVTNFTKAEQRSWLLRYDYDFSAIGVPGLLFTLRYVKSDQAEVVRVAYEGKERELDTDLGYVVQSGTFKDLGIRWRHGVMRNNYTRDSDQDRLIVDYTFKF
ncbi:OprD family porin [Pseudomonas sp. 3A(2025)]